jgi:putative transposase
MTIRPELIDELLKECSDPREVLAEGGLIKQLTKAIIERCLETELDAHLGYPKHGRRGAGTTNARNGSSRKKLKGAQGEIELAVPRDRQASGSATVNPEASDPLRGLRGQNPGALRARHDDQGYSSAGAGPLWGGGVPHLHLQHY